MSFASCVSTLQRRCALGVTTVTAISLVAAAAMPVQAQDSTLAARTRGSKTAPVTVYEMADFQCPFCRDFAQQTFPTLLKEYVNTGKVRWIFINLPIPSLHPNAEGAAEFASCAARGGKFWQAHDMLYATQEKWEHLKDAGPYFISQILPLGLDGNAMTKCLQSGAGAATVRDDVAGAHRTGAQSTPSFYIEGGIVEGARAVAVFEHVLDSIYKVKSGH